MEKEEGDTGEGKEDQEGSGDEENQCVFSVHIRLSLEVWFHEMIQHTELAHSEILYASSSTHQYPHVYSTSRKSCANFSPLKFSVGFSWDGLICCVNGFLGGAEEEYATQCGWQL